MTKLSLRLKAVTDLIEENSKVIDIGCDHGLLDVFLAKNKNCTCLATDISAICLEKAKENIRKYDVKNKVITKVTNGLEGIDYKIYDYVVITGMGFETIRKILENKCPNKLIIQSNNNLEELKRYLFKKYKLIDEKIVFENNIYYVILFLEKGKKKYKYEDYIIGLNKSDYDYIDFLYNKYKGIYNKIPNKYILKKINLYKKISVLKKYKKSINFFE